MTMTQKERQHLTALDSAYRDGCADRASRKPVDVWPWDDDAETAAAYMDGYNGRETAHHLVHGRPCEECRQVTLDASHALCGRCEDRARAPQGTQDRLFAPAPAQMAGQLNLGGNFS